MFRAIGMDVHRDFCEVAIVAGRRRSVRLAGSRRRRRRLSCSRRVLRRADRRGVGGDGQRGRDRADPRAARGAASWWSARTTPGSAGRARRPTAWTPARWPSCWPRVSWTRCGCPTSGRARCAGGWRGASQLVRARTRAKNEIHAVLIRRLAGPPAGHRRVRRPRSALARRRWSCPTRRRETVDSALRQLDFCERRDRGDRAGGGNPEALFKSPEVLRLMTLPGSLVTATPCSGPRRCPPLPKPRKLVGYLGLDPRVRLGARAGRARQDLKQGPAAVRQGWSRPRGRVQPPGPMRAFYQHLPLGAARRGRSSPWRESSRASSGACSPAREDYAFVRPSLTRRKTASSSSPRRAGAQGPGPCRRRARNKQMRDAERALARQGEAAYRRTVADWQVTRPEKTGASVTPGRASKGPRRAKPRGRPQAPDVCASLRQSPAPNPVSHRSRRTASP